MSMQPFYQQQRETIVINKKLLALASLLDEIKY